MNQFSTYELSDAGSFSSRHNILEGQTDDTHSLEVFLDLSSLKRGQIPGLFEKLIFVLLTYYESLLSYLTFIVVFLKCS